MSEKLFISPSVLNEILAGYCNLGCRFFSLNALNISCHSLLVCRLSVERSAIKRMGFSLYVTCCFFLAAFNILSLCLVFVRLVCILACLSFDLTRMRLFVPLGLKIDYFLFHVGEIFNYSLFKNFLLQFPFLFFFWDPYDSNVVAFDIAPEVSETILHSFHSFYFILLFKSYFHHFRLPCWLRQ